MASAELSKAVARTCVDLSVERDDDGDVSPKSPTATASLQHLPLTGVRSG